MHCFSWVSRIAQESQRHQGSVAAVGGVRAAKAMFKEQHRNILTLVLLPGRLIVPVETWLAVIKDVMFLHSRTTLKSQRAEKHSIMRLHWCFSLALTQLRVL